MHERASEQSAETVARMDFKFPYKLKICTALCNPSTSISISSRNSIHVEAGTCSCGQAIAFHQG